MKNVTRMKKVIILCIVATCCFFMTAKAQSTAWQALSYQAVALNENNQAIKNQTIWLRVSLRGNNELAKSLYSETHQVSTNENGAFQIAIGRGNPLNGQWSTIPWATQSVWIQIEMSQSGDNAFKMVSDKQLLAVPLALHAATANNLIDSKSSSLEKSQSIYWNTAGNSSTRPPTHFLGTADNQNLTFRSNNIAHMTLTTQGKLELVSKVPAGLESDKNAYPMVVEGLRNTQGMWIKINGTASNANNFMTFADATGIQGRIEGQTLSELEKSEIYVTQATLFALSVASTIAEIAALAIEYPFKLKSGYSSPSGVAVGFKIANLTAKGIALTTAYTLWVERIRRKVGVTYSSGNGDYAEWLRRKPGVRDLTFGEVVGIKEGLLSLDTKDADNLLVISKAPIVIGNAPQPEHEAEYEKVAFMGQVPVKVAGPVSVNDYIIPSGNNDGFAIAIHPENMKTLDYGKILGVAWESAENELINIVNVAIGIYTNDLASKVKELSSKVEQIEAYLAVTSTNKEAASALTLGANPLQSGSFAQGKSLSDREFDQFIDNNSSKVDAIYQDIRTRLDNQNFNYSANPILMELLNNPVETTKKLRRNSGFTTQWGIVDQKIQSTK